MSRRSRRHERQPVHGGAQHSRAFLVFHAVNQMPLCVWNNATSISEVALKLRHRPRQVKAEKLVERRQDCGIFAMRHAPARSRKYHPGVRRRLVRDRLFVVARASLVSAALMTAVAMTGQVCTIATLVSAQAPPRAVRSVCRGHRHQPVGHILPRRICWHSARCSSLGFYDREQFCNASRCVCERDRLQRLQPTPAAFLFR